MCSPALYWPENEKDFSVKKSNKKNNENQTNKSEEQDTNLEHQFLYTNGLMMNDEDCNLLISSQEEEKKSSINGLYLRNPRGN